MRWAVIHTIRGRKARRFCRLVVEDVPEGTSRKAVQEALETAGQAVDFTEAGVAWGNHTIVAEGRWPEELGHLDAAKRISWAKLDAGAERRITVRVPARLFYAVNLAAKSSGDSLNNWCLKALEAAAAVERPA